MNEGTSLGAYRIVRRLGAGGMGEVWEARHSLLGRSAAIKVLHPQYSSEPEIVARFFNEARAATAVADPGIVQIFDFGHHSDGSAYIVMEMLRGETLEQRLRRSGPLHWPDALRLVRQIASALGAAHAHGIVHRDLKPENLFVVADPEVAGGERIKVVDFGIAKLVGDDTVKTQTSAVMGTPLFMSPEQCRGAGMVEQRSDVYSLGCVLFALLTGRPPFVAEGIGDIIAMQLREPAPPPSHRAVGLPLAVDQLTLQCLEKEPSHRPSMSAVAMRIDYILGTVGALAANEFGARSSPSTHAVGAQGVATTLSASVAGASGARASSFAASYFTIAAVSTMLVGGGRWLALRDDGVLPPSVATPTLPSRLAPPQPELAPAVAPATDTGEAAGVAQLLAAATTFRNWAAEHDGEPCPDATSLALALDPWGQPIRFTCSAQPADQIVGIASSGPDQREGTQDDLVSWRLESVSDELRGARWGTLAPTPRRRGTRREPRDPERKATVRVAAAPTRPPAPRPASRLDIDGDGIPDVR